MHVHTTGRGINYTCVETASYLFCSLICVLWIFLEPTTANSEMCAQHNNYTVMQLSYNLHLLKLLHLHRVRH